MNRVIRGLILGILLSLAAACGSAASSGGGGNGAALAQDFTPAPQPPSQDQQFLNRVDGTQGMIVGANGDNTEIRLAHDFCGDLDSGDDAVEILAGAQDGGLSPAQAGTILGAAIEVYCPAYVSSVGNLQ